MRKCFHTDGDKHNCDYVNWRNSLIESAARTTDIEMALIGSDDPWVWDAKFHHEMDRLAREGGK